VCVVLRCLRYVWVFASPCCLQWGFDVWGCVDVILATNLATVLATNFATNLTTILATNLATNLATTTVLATILATDCRKPLAQPRSSKQHNEEGACCFQMNKSYGSKVVKRDLLRTPNWIS
jgi:hypothetical protein